MDIKTFIFALAIGNIIFGVVLFLYQLHEDQAERNTYWTVAKLLQFAGWLLLYQRGAIPDFLSYTIGNSCLLAGFAYESCAMFHISGRPVSKLLQITTLSSIVLICVASTPFSGSGRVAAASFVTVILFAPAGWILLTSAEKRSPLRLAIGWSMWLAVLIVLIRGTLALSPTSGLSLFTNNSVQYSAFIALYYLLLVNGFGTLLLSKEKADRDLFELSQEQNAILETLPTGLCIVKNRVIYRCNPALEAIYGFAPGTLQGQSVRCLYGSEQTFHEYGKKIYGEIAQKGRYEGEVLYARQNGEPFWALDHGTTIFPERSQAYAVFSITDITEQKRQQELLTCQKEELQATLARTKRLEGIISICMHCKKIHTADQSWEQLEKYISDNSDAQFSHGLCPACFNEHYAQYKRKTVAVE